MDAANPKGDVVNFQEAARRTKVREARYDDVVPIYGTLIKALESLDTPFPEPELPYALQVMLDAIAQRYVAVVVDGYDNVVGCIWLDLKAWPWNRAKGLHLYNEHYWVEPAYRRGGAGVRLLKWAKDRADEMGVDLLIDMASIDGAETEKDNFVKSQGFRYLGGKFFRKTNRP